MKQGRGPGNVRPADMPEAALMRWHFCTDSGGRSARWAAELTEGASHAHVLPRCGFAMLEAQHGGHWMDKEGQREVEVRGRG